MFPMQEKQLFLSSLSKYPVHNAVRRFSCPISNEYFVSKGNLFYVYFATLKLVLVPCGGRRKSPHTSL